MKKIIISLFMSVFLFAIDYQAPIFQFWKNLDWKFFFDKFKIDFKLCSCEIKNTHQKPVGFKMSFVEPIGGIDVTNEPWKFVGLGFQLDKNVRRREGKSRADEDLSSFRYVHFLIFPPLGMTFGLVQDYICFERGDIFNLAFLSEVIPSFNNDILAMFEEAERPASRIWFANPIAELACSIDCSASTFGHPINSLYWCDGCMGSVNAGNSGYSCKTNGKPYEEAEVMAFRMIDEMSFYGQMLKTKESTFAYLPRGIKLLSSLCRARYFPLIIKDQYYLQPAYEDKGADAEPFGKIRTHYDFKMNKKMGDDVFFWLWREKTICAGAMQCKSTFSSF